MSWHKLYHIANWVYNIALVNILWIIFTLLGLGLLGIFPATAAMFSIVRKWIVLRERDFNIFSTFWSFFRKGFLKLNGFALFFFIIGYLLYINATFLILNPDSFPFLIPGTILFIILYVMILLFFFPVFVHYDLTFFQYMKQALFLAILSPLELIGMVVAGGLLIGFIVWIPGIIPLFTGSVMAFCVTFLVNRSFRRIAKKAEVLV